jgi:hypothetical protein
MSPRQRFLTSAIVGGSVASLCMDVAQYTWAFLLERDRPSGDQDEETEAITSVVAILTRLSPGTFPAANAAQIGRVIHYVFGIGFAAGYLYLLPRGPATLLRGSVFGTLLWLLSDRILIPVFKLGRPWSRYSVTERSNALVSHLVYAIIVEFSRIDE